MKDKLSMRLLIDLLFPPKCAGCGELVPLDSASTSACKRCLAKWEIAKNICRSKNGGQPVRIFNKELAETDKGGYAMYCVYYHPGKEESAEKSIILHLKYRRGHGAVHICASALADIITENVPESVKNGADIDKTVITWIPRRKEAVAKYGFDHMELVARSLTALLGIPSYKLLKRRMISREQKTLTAEERRENADSMMKLSHRFDIKGKTVILIDDIITTGASVNAATNILLSAGARQVITAVIAETNGDLS